MLIRRTWTESTEFSDMLNFALSYVSSHVMTPSDAPIKVILNVTETFDRFAAARATCWQVQQGALLLINTLGSNIVQFCSYLSAQTNVPMISLTATFQQLDNTEDYPFLIRLLPPDSFQGMAVANLLKQLRWKAVALLSSGSAYGLHGMSSLRSMAPQLKLEIIADLQFASNKSIEASLTSIYQSGARVVILHCESLYAREIFQEARRLHMTETGWQWIVTDDIVTIKPTDFAEKGELEGLLGIGIFRGTGSLYDKVMAEWKARTNRSSTTLGMEKLFDSLVTAAHALKIFQASARPATPRNATDMSCLDSNSVIPEGNEMRRILLEVKTGGIATDIEFDEKRKIKTFSYKIVNLLQSNWKMVGLWTHSTEDKLGKMALNASTISYMNSAQITGDFYQPLENQTLEIVFVLEPPFIMLKNNSISIRNMSHVPVDLLEGFCIDLLLEVQKSLKFQFVLYRSPDGWTGKQNQSTGRWNGMMKELIDKKAHVALSSFVVTRSREQFIDFSAPFYHGSLQFAEKSTVSVSTDRSLFSTLSPVVWYNLLATWILSAFCAHVSSLISKSFRTVGSKSDKSRKHDSFHQSFWISSVVLMRQGIIIAPRTISAKLTMVLWSFTALITITSYTAHLTAWETSFQLKIEAELFDHLFSDTQVQIGIHEGGASSAFFEQTKIFPYQELYHRMSDVDSLEEGIDKVCQGNFAFACGSATMKYYLSQRPCNLRIRGRSFTHSSYAFGFPKNSRIKEAFSLRINRLKDGGIVDDLEKKWILLRDEYDEKPMTSQRERVVAYEDVKDVFLIIYGGFLFALLLLVVEWIVACIQDTRRQNPRSETLVHAFHRRIKTLIRQMKRDCPLRSSRVSDVSQQRALSKKLHHNREHEN